MTTQSAVAAIKARLETGSWPWPVAVVDGVPSQISTPYICIYDQTGMPLRRKYKATVDGLFFPFQLSCVARTTDGLRTLVAGVRAAVLDWPPVAGASPIVEDGSNPILSEGVGNDQRLTAPLTMHCYLPKEES